MICFLFLFSSNVSASQKIKTGKVTVYKEDIKTINFSIPYNSYVVMEMKIVSDELADNEGLNLVLRNYDNAKEYDNVTFDSFVNGQTDLGEWYQGSDLKLSKGRYSYDFSNYGNSNLKISYTIRIYDQYTRAISFSQKNITIQTDRQKTISLKKTPDDSFAVIKKVKSSNEKVAKAYDYKEKIIIEGIGPGKSTITVLLDNGNKASIKVKVSDPAQAKIQYTSGKVYVGESFKNTLKYFHGKVTWSSSNKKIATVTKAGKITGKKTGKCVITAKAGKKKYKCSVEVIAREPDFRAVLADYYTRNNYFEVVYQNTSTKNLMITSGIKVENVDYKSYDRQIRLKKTVTIKPGKKAKVRFYVKGSNTWYDYSDFTVFYKFKFDGITYEGHVWDEDSVFRKGKKWYSTYMDEDTYIDWRNDQEE